MNSENVTRLTVSTFGNLTDGRVVSKFTIRNVSGASVEVIDLGGIIVSINIPDRDRVINDITLGYDNPQQYLDESPYFGAIVGRYANRIADGKFSIDGKEYSIAQNNGPNALHGGIEGFDKKIWDTTTFETENSAGVRLTLISEDGDQGYPGTLTTEVTYTFDDENQLIVEYRATTDKTTVINLSQHAYFNLNGHSAGYVGDHEMLINASHYTPVGETLIPTGEISPVENTPMDFRSAKPIGQDIEADFEQLRFGEGYDHNLVLDDDGLSLAASVYAPSNGRVMEVYTDQPGIQFYTGNFLDGSSTGKEGIAYARRGGFCLETQHFPDSPNHDNFPSTLLRPGEVFESKTIFRYFTREVNNLE